MLTNLRKVCGHGKPVDEECLACAMLWRIEQRKDAEIARLRARVQELETTNSCPLCYAKFDERCLAKPDETCPQPWRAKGPRPYVRHWISCTGLRLRRDTNADGPPMGALKKLLHRVPVMRDSDGKHRLAIPVKDESDTVDKLAAPRGIAIGIIIAVVFWIVVLLYWLS